MASPATAGSACLDPDLLIPDPDELDLPRKQDDLRSYMLVRALILAKLLESQRGGRGLDVMDLANAMGVSTRTVWRDVSALRRAGAEIDDYQDDRNRRRIRKLRWPANWPPPEIEQLLRERRESMPSSVAVERDTDEDDDV
jgi:biotin operon repressor